MPDLMNYLRMANIFSPMVGNDLPQQGGITGNMPRQDPFGNISFGNPQVIDPRAMGDTPIASPDDYDAGARMRELYTPQHEAEDRYNELAGGYPKMEEYRPSGLRRIGAALTALSGSFGGPAGHRFQFNPNSINMGMEVLNDPYNKQLGDWKNQIGPAQTAANLERSENVNNRTLAYQTVQQEQNQHKIDSANKIAEGKLKVSQDRAAAYQLKQQMGAGYTFNFTGPTVMAANKQTGEVKDTGIATGSLTDADKLALQQDNAIQRIQATGNEQRQTEGVRQEGRESLQASKGWAIGSIPDPADPTKQIGVRYNADTGAVEPIKFGGQNTGPITKPGTKSAATDTNLQNIQQKTQDTLSALDELVDENGKLKPNMRGAVGASRMFGMQYLPATEARTAQATINRVKSLLIVDLIGEMKAQSRTGATGFGQLNMKELSVLENAASKLDPAMKEEDFESEIKRIKEKLQKVLQPADGLNPTTVNKPVMKQYSPSRNQTRISKDGGQTWEIVEGKQ